PPPHVKFLLATTDPQKLPATVLSRCLQFNLKRLTPGLIQERLALICDAEEIEAEAAALAILSRAADGSLRDALSLLDQAIAYCGGKVEADSVSLMLGTIDREHVVRLLRLLAADDAPGVIDAVAEIDEQFPDYGRLLEDLARMLQRIAVYQVVGSTDPDDELGDELLKEFAGSLPASDVQLFYQTALIGRRDLPMSPDPRSGVEMALLRMLAFKPATAASSGTAGSSTGKAPAASQAEAAPAAKSVQAAARAAMPQEQDPDWAEIMSELGLAGSVKLLASNCAYICREGNTVHFNLDPRSESLLTRQRTEALAAALSKHFNEPLSVDINVAEVIQGTPHQEESRLADERIEAARISLESDPNVKTLKSMFGAELKTDSIELLNPGQSK
ncbi:MAG: DNA polymerase III subunit gamma/tau C-terminal domain-containing protein, partial [Woeseiaceae bacterium]